MRNFPLECPKKSCSIYFYEKLDLHKFTRCKYGAKKCKVRSKSKAKIVNTAFACQFTWGCKFEGKCGIYHLCHLFNLSLHFFAPNLHRVNLCKSNFSCIPTRFSGIVCKWWATTVSMETVIEIAINQISLTNESIIAATFNFKCTKNAKTMCGSSSLPWSKVKRSFREVFKDYFNVLNIYLIIG